MKSEYKDKLLQEYKNYGLQPVTIKLNNEEIIIPAEYVVGKEKEEAQKSFFRDYFPGISGGEMLDPVEKPVLP